MELNDNRMLRADATDAALLASSKERPEAFGEFFERYQRKVLDFFYRRTGCSEIAADLTSETFAAAFLARRRYRDTGAPADAWLLTIARRKLVDSLGRGRAESKARRRLGVRPVPLDDSAIEEIEATVDLRAMRQEVREAMGSLPEKCHASPMKAYCLPLRFRFHHIHCPSYIKAKGMGRCRSLFDAGNHCGIDDCEIRI